MAPTHLPPHLIQICCTSRPCTHQKRSFTNLSNTQPPPRPQALAHCIHCPADWLPLAAVPFTHFYTRIPRISPTTSYCECRGCRRTRCRAFTILLERHGYRGCRISGNDMRGRVSQHSGAVSPARVLGAIYLGVALACQLAVCWAFRALLKAAVCWNEDEVLFAKTGFDRKKREEHGNVTGNKV